ncbi:hypothetical protein ACTMU2_16905 [Cupriavidus basilensis]
MAVGLDGLVMKQREDGAPLEVAQRPDRSALTAAVIDAAESRFCFRKMAYWRGLNAFVMQVRTHRFVRVAAAVAEI